MAAAVAPDPAERVAQLEDELATVRAQSEATSINWEQATQAMEQRYSALSEEFDKSVEAKERLRKELDAASQELRACKSESYNLQTQIVAKDASNEQQSVKLTELQSDVQRLLRVSEQKDAQLAEQQELVASYLAKVQAVTAERVELGARLAASERVSSQAAAVKERLEQEKANLEKHNAWLVEELDRKSDDLLAHNRNNSNQLAEARAEIQTSKARVTELEISEGNLKHKVESLSAEFEAVQRRQEAAADDANMQLTELRKELETSTRLGELRKEAAEQAKGRVTELEGVLRELKEGAERVVAAKDEELKKAEEVRAALEAECERQRESVQRMMTAAQTGQQMAVPQALDFGQGIATPPVGTATPGFGAPRSGGVSLTPPTPSTLPSGLTTTELYSKYMVKDAECRQERVERRRIEKMMDEMVRQVEVRAAHMQEQKAEYIRVMGSYATLQEHLAAADSDRQRLEGEKGQLLTEIERVEKEHKKSEQILKDCSAQLQRMIWENQELRHPGAGGAAPVPADTGGSGDGAVTGAGDVISAHLVAFSDVKELEQRNKQLLSLTRDLSEQLEEQELKAKEKLEAEITNRTTNMQAQLEQLTSSRKRQEELARQIIRQRDFYRSMLEQAGTSLPALPALSPNAHPAPASGATEVQRPSGEGELQAVPPPGVPDYRALHADLSAELENVRTETAENIRMLQEEKAALRREASKLKEEAERAQGTATFERERYQRLIGTSDSHRRELEAVLRRNAEVTALLGERESRLRQAAGEAEAAAAAVRREREKVSALSAEKGILEAAEARASAEATELTKDKCRLAATLEAAQKLSEQQLQENQRERERLTAEVRRMTAEWADLQRVLATEKASAASAARSLDELTKDSGETRRRLEAEVRSLRDEKSTAEQRAAVAEGKVEVISTSLRKAEERAASLARSGGGGASAGGPVTTSTGDGAEAAKLATDMVILRQELAAAQEAAAAALGHVEQYKAIATSSDDALKRMQASHEAFKAGAEQAAAAAQEAAAALRAKLDASEEANSEARAAAKAAEERLAGLEGAVERETATLKERLAQEEGKVAAQAQRVSALEHDVEQHHRSWRTAQQLYEQELVAHADKVKALNESEKEREALHVRIAAAEKSLDEARAELASAVSETQGANAAREAAVAAADARVAEVNEQNNALHAQLERLAAATKSSTGEGGGGEGGGLTEVVKFLRREKETAECQLSLMQQEARRWQQQATRSDRAAAQARQQLEAGLANSRADVAAEGEHQELMERVQHLNLLRESNVALRAECENHANSYREAKQQLEAARAQVEEANRKMRDMEAGVAAKDSELAMAKEEARRWETRSQQLLQKYKSVDPKEHQRVVEQLKAAQDSLKDAEGADSTKKALEEEVSKAKVGLERAQAQEKLAKRYIMTVYNPRKLSIPAWRAERDRRDAKLEELEAALAKAKEEATKLASAVPATSVKDVELVKAREDARKAGSEIGKMSSKIKSMEHRHKIAMEALRKAKVKVASLESEVASRDEKIAQLKAGAAPEDAGEGADEKASGDPDGGEIPEAQPAAETPAAPASNDVVTPSEAVAQADPQPEDKAAEEKQPEAGEVVEEEPTAPGVAEDNEGAEEGGEGDTQPPPAKRHRLNADAPEFQEPAPAAPVAEEVVPEDMQMAEEEVEVEDGADAELAGYEEEQEGEGQPQEEEVVAGEGAEASVAEEEPEEGEVPADDAMEEEEEAQAEEAAADEFLENLLADEQQEEGEAAEEAAAVTEETPTAAEETPATEEEAPAAEEAPAVEEAPAAAEGGTKIVEKVASAVAESPSGGTATGGARKTPIQWAGKPAGGGSTGAVSSTPAAAPATVSTVTAAVPPKTAATGANAATAAVAAAAAANAALSGSSPAAQTPTTQPSHGRGVKGGRAGARGRAGKRGRGVSGKGAGTGRGGGRSGPPP